MSSLVVQGCVGQCVEGGRCLVSMMMVVMWGIQCFVK